MMSDVRRASAIRHKSQCRCGGALEVDAADVLAGSRSAGAQRQRAGVDAGSVGANAAPGRNRRSCGSSCLEKPPLLDVPIKCKLTRKRK
jgi:hypothetical protein